MNEPTKSLELLVVSPKQKKPLTETIPSEATVQPSCRSTKPKAEAGPLTFIKVPLNLDAILRNVLRSVSEALITNAPYNAAGKTLTGLWWPWWPSQEASSGV